ncbi:MAG: UDP-glucose 4-epimerase GalE [Candidatus Saccharimonadales bacterium]
MSKILVTGGAGYIGSHTIIELMAAGHEVVVADNFCNSKPEAIKRVKKLTGAGATIPLIEVDLCDAVKLEQVFKSHEIDAVIHFAGLKAVGESVKHPLRYYQNNVGSTLNLLETMLRHGVHKLVFSSSATVYGNPASVPINEEFPLVATNPYGETKLMIERMLRDVCAANPDFYVSCLRYFNPVGAHPSGLIGEDPNGVPNNLLPYVAQVAAGKLEQLNVFGGDYLTPDGTGVRDYIHVGDLARGHVAALEHIKEYANFEPFNLGSGTGYSVLEVIKTFEEAAGKPIPYQIVGRRDGDIAACYAEPAKANSMLGWKTEKTLLESCADSWNWQSKNPDGYPDPA